MHYHQEAKIGGSQLGLKLPVALLLADELLEVSPGGLQQLLAQRLKVRVLEQGALADLDEIVVDRLMGFVEVRSGLVLGLRRPDRLPGCPDDPADQGQE